MKKRYLIFLLSLLICQAEIYSQAISRNAGAPMVPDSVITWKFDSEGDSTLNMRMNYLYDSHMHVIQSEKFTREQSLHLWVPSRKVQWEFDNQDRRTLWAIYEWDNNAMAYIGFIKETTVFDSHGKKTEYHFYTWNYSLFDWGNRFWDLFDYNNENKLTLTNHLEWNGDAEQWDTASYDIYEYGGDGFLEQLTIWEPYEEFGGVIYPAERRDYQYDASGNELEWVGQIYNPNTELWYFSEKHQYAYDVQNRKTNSMYSEFDEGEEKWINKEKDEWGWNDSDSMTLYAYYRIGEDLLTWYPQLKAEMTYNNLGKLIHYRGYSGNDQAQWEPTYERRYGFKDDILPLSDSLFQWIPDDENWEVVDCHNYVHDTLARMYTDSYYAWVVHTQQLELSTRSYYFYSETAGIEEQEGMEAWGQGGVEVWPNPTSGIFNLQFTIYNLQSEGTGIELVDLNGIVRETWNTKPGTWNAGILELDISRYPAGVYFMRKYFENQMIVKKIIKL